MNSGKALLFDALVSGCGLQALVDTASRFLGRSLVLCDVFWIARNMAGKMNSSESLLKSGRDGHLHLKPDFLETYEQSRSADSRWTRLISDGHHCLVRPICLSDSIPLAYLVVIGQKNRFRQDQQAFIEIFCQVLLNSLQQPTGSQQALLPLPETLLQNLVRGGDNADLGGIHEVFNQKGSEYFVCVIDAILGKTLRAPDTRKLVDQVDYQNMIEIDGHPVLLINCGNDNMSAFQSAGKKLSEQLATLNCRGGISYPFANIDDFNLYYRQARRAIEYGIVNQPGPTLTAYLDIACFDLAAVCGTNQANGQHGLHPAIQTIIRHDKIHGTRYFKTVAAIVESGGNIKACAQSLDVRWSTLNNRINRISDLFDINLKDQNTLRQLYFSSGMAGLCDLI